MGSFLKKLTILSPYSSPKPNEFFPNIASIYESINKITKIKNHILNILSVLSLKNKKFIARKNKINLTKPKLRPRPIL